MNIETQMFQYLVTCLSEYISTTQQKQKHKKKQRIRSACQLSNHKKQKNPPSLNKSQKLSRAIPKIKSTLTKYPSSQQQHTTHIVYSQKKQKINQICILCGKGPCDNRLACAHAIHDSCFIKSQFIPLCRQCQSKNISSKED